MQTQFFENPRKPKKPEFFYITTGAPAVRARSEGEAGIIPQDFSCFFTEFLFKCTFRLKAEILHIIKFMIFVNL